jgi:hypothetical protein
MKDLRPAWRRRGNSKPRFYDPTNKNEKRRTMVKALIKAGLPKESFARCPIKDLKELYAAMPKSRGR